jgi:ABC-type antimicrobial peptide transport system permease subunit
MVVAQGARVLGIGIVLGAAASIAATRPLADLLFGVTPFDPATYVALSLILALVGLAACYVPAWRASRVDPMTALRVE